MVRVCAFPDCGNKMKGYLCLSFHRLPFRNRATLRFWLIALQLDVLTPLKTLREKDYRVCGEHFDEEDFTEKSSKCRHLNANAIPKAKRSKTDHLMDTDSMMSEMCIIQGCNGTEELLSFPKDPSTLQQWMLCLDGRLKHAVNSSSKVCSAHFTSDSSAYWQENHSSVAANLILKTGALPSHVDNEQVGPCPQERASVGSRCDLQQTWPTEDTGVSESIPLHTHSKATRSPAPTHISLGEGLDFLLHPAKVVTIKRDHCAVHTTVWTSRFESKRNKSDMHGRSALMSDIVVNLACLLQLFQKCLKCCSDACSVSVRRKGPIIHVLQRCWTCGNSREWTSQQQSIKPSVQPPHDPMDSREAKEKPVETSEDVEDEITVKIEEEEEEEEEEEAHDEAEMEKEEEEDEVVEEVETADEKEVQRDEEEVVEMDEETEEADVEVDEVTEEKAKKRKRRDSDGEWAPDDGVVTETSEEECEEGDDKEEEEEEEEKRRPHRWTWCCDCGVSASMGCFIQKHLQLYCCKLCGYRDGYQEPKNSELLETQRISSPETPSAGHQEGTDDVGQSAESSCSPEDDGNNNKPTDSSDGPEDPNSCTSQEPAIDSASQHASTNSIEGPFSNGVDASTCKMFDYSKGICSREQWGTNQDASLSQLGSSNSHQQTSASNKGKQNLPIYAVYFKDHRYLQSHMRRLHSGKRHLCPDCGAFYNIRDGKTSHICDLTGKPFSCLTCGRRFRKEARLKLHVQFHNEDFTTKCQYCYETFKQKEDKERHEETHVGENLLYHCPECPKRFANKHTRKAHISTAHFKGGRFVCKVCDKGFHFEFKLKRHEVVHSGVKPFRCDQCDRSFNQPGHLKSHMRVHTGERPFMCHECGLCFNHNVSLKNHAQRKHRSAPDGDDDGYREEV